MRACVCARAYV